MKEKDERSLYISQKLINMAYNTKYNFIKLFQQYEPDSFCKPQEIIYILGQKFQTNQQNISEARKLIFEVFRMTPWLTYRSGFPELCNQLSGSYVSDTGWGCMVRVGQMMFAQVIKFHKKAEKRQQILNVISLFSDYDRQQPFSIHNIAQLARKQYNLEPGQWYNPSQIAFILGHLNQQYMATVLKLKFVIFNSGNLFFDTVIDAMLGKKPICECSPKSTQLVCPVCNKAEFSVSLIVLSRLGLNGPEKKYLHILSKLMQSEFSQGVMGGKPQKALYFLGLLNDNYIYLDPHYVQDADKDLNSKQQTYFCQSLRMCKNTAIDSSIGICFYVRDVASLNEFHKEINKVRSQNYEDFFIFIADQTPNYIKKLETPRKSKAVENDDDFQFL